MTKDDFMDLVPYLIMGCGLTIALLELSKVFQ
mgnify:CR=1 FL=1